MKRTCLVIPTIRDEHNGEFEKFAKSWKGAGWDKVVVVVDKPQTELSDEKVCDLMRVNRAEVFTHTYMKSLLGENVFKTFSRKDSGIRSFGFWRAWKENFEVIFTLDDDCRPCPQTHPCNFVAEHCRILTKGLNKFESSIPRTRIRGLPYVEGLNPKIDVHLSVGLWEGVPDYDAISQLYDPSLRLKLPEDRILPSCQYFPLCGMNMAFTHEFTPLMYFPLMGEDWPFARFDDIWAGIIAQKIAHHLNFNIHMGRPFVYHSRASNPFTNLKKEAPGVEVNEVFWKAIDEIDLTGRSSRIECIWEIALQMKQEWFQLSSPIMGQYREYWSSLSTALYNWGNLFDEK